VVRKPQKKRLRCGIIDYIELFNPTTQFPQQKERTLMKKYTALSIIAMSCLSCNPIVVQPDAGVQESDAGTEEQTSNHVFKPQKITIAEVR